MHLRLTSLALVILVPASAAVLPVHNLLTDATPESAAAAAMRAHVDPAMGELLADTAPGTAMHQPPIPRLALDSKIEVLDLTDGVEDPLFHGKRHAKSATLGKDGSSQTECPEKVKARANRAAVKYAR